MHSDGRQKARAFSLVEVMVAAGISLLLAGVVIKIFIPAMSHSAQGTTRLELQQFAVLAHQKIRKELLRSRFGGVSTADATLLIHPQVALDSVGQPVWDTDVLVFHLDRSTQKLGRYSLPSEPVQPNRYTPTALLTRIAALPPAEKIIASFASEFIVTPSVPATATTPPMPMTIQLTLEKDIPQRDQPVQITLSRSFSFRTAD